MPLSKATLAEIRGTLFGALHLVPEDCIAPASDAMLELLAHIDQQAAELERVTAERDRLFEAVDWALGCASDFAPRKEGQGAYWWRTELRNRANVKWDGERNVIARYPDTTTVLPSTPWTGSRSTHSGKASQRGGG